MNTVEDPPSSGALVGSAIVFYALMSLVGLGALALTGESPRTVVFGDGTGHLADLAWGGGSGLAAVLLTWTLRNLPSLQALNAEFRAALGAPSTLAITVLAVTSSIGEEVFFRGALQSWLGLGWTVLIFGFVHGGLNRKLRAWMVFATLAGAWLGWLTEFTGSLLAPMLCHFTVNYFNLHIVCGQQEAAG